jgi:peptidoglycan/LPS O-acetylase OafA/YrhL
MTLPDAAARSRARLQAGDPLRGLAAIGVAVGHVLGLVFITWSTDGRSVGIPPAGEGFGPLGDLISALGTAGVCVFFVLSGYLLGRPFVRGFVLGGGPPPSASAFARNRVVRIVPAYWTLLALVFLLVVLPGGTGVTARDLLRLAVFDGSLDAVVPQWLGQIWTLAVEMRFYVLLLVVGMLLVLAGNAAGPRLPGRARVGVLVATALGLAAWSFFGHPLRSAYFAITFDATAGRFSAGVLLAVAEVTTLRPWLARRARRAAPVLFVVGAAALCLLSVAYSDPQLPLAQATQWALTLAAGVVVAGPLLWQWGDLPAWRALDNAPLRWAGSRSYSLYLVHFPLYAGLLWAFPGHDHSAHVALLALVGLPLALVAADVLHRVVERPALRLRAPSQAAP